MPITYVTVPPPPVPQNVGRPAEGPLALDERPLTLEVLTGEHARWTTGKMQPVVRIPTKRGALLLNVDQLRSILAIMETS